MRVALYARVSTEEQAKHGISIDAQVEALRKWATDQGHEIIGEYIDNGVSARKSPSKRPALQDLLADIPEKKIALIAFCKLDRWTRNVKGYYQVQDVLDRHKVAWIAIQEDYETITASGRFKVNIMLSVAENEADRTSERIKAVLDHKVNMGEAITRSLPIGLKIEGKKVVPDENADAARSVFDEFIRTANTLRARDYLQYNYGISLPLLSIRNLLRNELYIGRYRGNTDYCEPIIQADVFEEAQRLLDLRCVKQTAARNVYLFSGLVFCAECGHRMTGLKTKVMSYRCNAHYELKRCDHAGYYNEQKLEQYILTRISELVAGKELEYKAAPKKKQTVDRAAVKRKLERLKDLYLDGDIDKEKYRAERDKLTPLLDTQPEPVSKALNIIGDNFLEDYAKMTREQKQRTWRKVIDRITISTDKEISIFLR